MDGFMSKVELTQEEIIILKNIANNFFLLVILFDNKLLT